MGKTIKELKEERAKLHEQMHTLVSTAEARSEAGFTPEERAQYDGLKQSYEAIQARIRTLEEDEARAAELATRRRGAAGDGAGLDSPEERASKHQEELRSAFIDFIRGRAVKPELRAELFTGSAENQVIVPKLISEKVIIALRDTGDFLGAVDLIVTDKGEPLTIAMLDGTSKKLKKVTEGTANTTDKVKFEGVTLGAYEYATPIFPISMSLMEDASIDVEAAVVNVIVDCIKEGLKELITTTGSGSNDVKALTIAATSGAESAAADAISYDDLVALRASVNNAYGKAGVGRFVMNSNTMAACLKIKDTTGRPIFIESVRDDQPDRLLGREVIINEYMPDIAAGAKAVAFGDFKSYKLRIVKDFRIIIFREKYADKLQLGVMGYVRADGNLADAGTHPVKVLTQKSE